MEEYGSQEQPPDPLHDLSVDTAIRLRGVLRDLRASRIELLMSSSDDLALLEQFELIRTENGRKPVLTDMGKFDKLAADIEIPFQPISASHSSWRRKCLI